MGFFNKLWSWVRGNGFTEEPKQQEAQQTKEEPRFEEPPLPPRREETTPEPEPVRTTEPERKVTPKPVTPVKQESDFDKQLREVERQLAGKPALRDIEGKINPDTLNSVGVQERLLDLSHVRPYYAQLFQENAKITDPEITEILIQNRDKLRHRFTIEYTFFDTNGEVAKLTIIGGLVEDAQHIHNLVKIGITYEYFKETLDTAINSFRMNFGALEGNHNYTDLKPVTITDIKTDVTFA